MPGPFTACIPAGTFTAASQAEADALALAAANVAAQQMAIEQCGSGPTLFYNTQQCVECLDMSDSFCVPAGTYSSSVSQADANAQALAAAQAEADLLCPTGTCPNDPTPAPPTLITDTPVSLGFQDLMYSGQNPNHPQLPADLITWGELQPGSYHIDYISGFFNIKHTYPDTEHPPAEFNNDNHYTTLGAWGQLLYTNLTANIQASLPQSDVRGNTVLPGFSCSVQPDIDIPTCADRGDIEALTRAENPAYEFCAGRGRVSTGTGIAVTQVWINTVQRDTAFGAPLCPDGNDCNWVPVTTGPIRYELIKDVGLVCDQWERLRIRNWATDALPFLTACSPDSPDFCDPVDPDGFPAQVWDGTFPFANFDCPGTADENWMVVYTIYSAVTGQDHQYTIDDAVIRGGYNPGVSVQTSIKWFTNGSEGKWILNITCGGSKSIWYGEKTTGCTGEGIYVQNLSVAQCSDGPMTMCVEHY